MNRLTFDDGLLNTYEIAFPLMAKYELTGTVFVVTGILKGELQNFRHDQAPYMNLQQVKQLHKAGWEIGSHSVTHPFFHTITLEKAEWELHESKRFLESRGFNVKAFAFPYGHGYYTDEQIKIAKEYYSEVRTVNDKRGLVNGIPVDKFPSKEEGVFVIHLVKDPKQFEGWIKNIRT